MDAKLLIAISFTLALVGLVVLVTSAFVGSKRAAIVGLMMMGQYALPIFYVGSMMGWDANNADAVRQYFNSYGRW